MIRLPLDTSYYFASFLSSSSNNNTVETVTEALAKRIEEESYECYDTEPYDDDTHYHSYEDALVELDKLDNARRRWHESVMLKLGKPLTPKQLALAELDKLDAIR